MESQRKSFVDEFGDPIPGYGADPGWKKKMVKDATETHECLAFIKRPDLLEENRKAGWRRFRACRLFFIRREGDRAEVAVTVFRDEADTWQHGHNIADAIVRRKFNPKDFDYKLVTEVIKGDWHARPSR